MGEISSGIELFRILLSENLIEMRLVDKAGEDNIPLVFWHGMSSIRYYTTNLRKITDTSHF